MKLEVFQRGIDILSSCIVDFKATVDPDKLEVWYGLTQELSDRIFLEAIKRICKKTTNIYPGTNIVGLIHEQAGIALTLMQNEPTTRLQLEDGMSDRQFEDGLVNIREIKKITKGIGGVKRG